MSSANRYDVTDWPIGDAADDIGEVINSIIADIKRRQSDSDVDDGGKPGAVIYLPPGDYRLRTQVLIDISFLRIEGSGHGFTSSSIRFNVPAEEWGDLHELWPGGSRILVDLPIAEGADQAAGAAFLVERGGSPRISSVEFSNFCIDGLHFVADGSALHPENTYVNGKTGIHVASANDSFRINGMGFVYLEHALTIHNADALSIHDNFIAECGSCIELRGWGQASKITDNLIGAGPKGHSIYAEHHGGLLVTANNVFPRGASSVHFEGVTRSSITNNRLHSFYPGMVVLDDELGEPRRVEPLPARPRAVGAVRRRRQRARRRLRAAAGERQRQLGHRQPLLRGRRLGDASGRRARRPSSSGWRRASATSSRPTTWWRRTCAARRASRPSRPRSTRCCRPRPRTTLAVTTVHGRSRHRLATRSSTRGPSTKSSWMPRPTRSARPVNRLTSRRVAPPVRSARGAGERQRDRHHHCEHDVEHRAELRVRACDDRVPHVVPDVPRAVQQ